MRLAADRIAGRRSLPLLLALAALIFALLGALGPAQHVHTRYSWPPAALPGAEPQSLWYTPLLLTRNEPESLSVTLPCALPPALPRAKRPLLVLGTVPEWQGGAGLAVLRTGNRLLLRIGDAILTTVHVGTAPASGCAYRLRIAAGSWSLAGGPGGKAEGGSLGSMPLVVGVFSGLDLRRGARPAIDVTTVVHRAKTTIRQEIFWLFAILGAVAALLMVLPRRRPGRGRTVSALGRGVSRLGLPDAFISVLLLVWWVFGPSFFDDGWVQARQGNYSASGGFSAYYSSFGVNLPLAYWLEWLEHWLVESSSSLLVFRLPALVCLAAAWTLCRWILTRVVGPGGGSAARWALACCFAVGALAWGMTFRPEPVLALLVAGVLACAVRFVESQSIVPLAGAAILVALSLSAHPAGIVALAPLLAIAPAIVRWMRSHSAAAVTVAAGAGATLIVLLSVGSDVQQRRADVASLRMFGEETAGWRDELTRYTFLSQAPYGTPLRRASVALIVLAVLAYLLRARRNRAEPLLGLPATALGLALLLFVATPTKWPWHFGALVGLAAAAAAAETARLQAEWRSGRGWDVRPFLAVGAAVAAAAWSWNPRDAWSDLDLRTLHWTLGFERTLTLSKLAGSVPVVFLVVLAVVELARRTERRPWQVPWRAAVWTVPVLAVPVIAFTVAVLVADTAKTSSWTLARQNLDALRGDVRCGLADSAVVPVRASMHALALVGAAGLEPPAPWLPPAPAPGLDRFTLSPPGTPALPSRSPWFRLRSGQHTGFFLAGIPAATERLELEWGRIQGTRIASMAASVVAGDAATDARPDLSFWRFYAAGNLPPPPSGANTVRFSLSSEGPGQPIGLTAPVTYSDEPLASLLEREVPALALPNLLTFVPCIRQPQVGDTAEVPHLILAFRDSMWPLGTGTSPFDGLPSLYRFVRLPLSDSADPPGDVAVYAVDRRIDGAAVAPPLAASTG